MYDADKKLAIMNQTSYKLILQAIFNNSEEMEHRLGDISNWITQDFAEYCARYRIYTSKSLSTFKSAIKLGYIKPLGISTDEIDDLDLHLVYSKVQNLHIRVFWSDVNKLVRTIRNALEDDANDRRIFTYNGVIVASALMYCGIDFKDLSTIKRDDVVSKGIWSYNLPVKIPRQSIAAELVMQYAKQSVDLMEEVYPGLPLVRGGMTGRKPLSFNSYRMFLSNANNVVTRSPIDYDITIQNIVLSGEFTRIYGIIGNSKDYDPMVMETIPMREHIKISNIAELQNLYALYCMTVD